MATVDKNFRIKNGLVVEGTTGTINGNNILTESAGDSYILNLVGGATLVKSVDTTVFNVDGSGKLTVNANVFDTYGSASTAQSNAESYTDSAISTEVTNRNNAINTAKSDAISTAETYTDSAISQEVTDRNSAISSAISTEVSDRNSAISSALSTAENYTDTAISQEVSDRNSAISTALTTAKNYTDSALSTAESYADTAATNAENSAKSYTDSAISSEVSRANSAYDALGSASSAQTAAQSYADTAATNAQNAAESYADTVATNAENAAKSYADTAATNAENAAKSYTDTKVADLVNSAPSTLDTLKKIDDAINNDANFSSTLLSDIATAQATAESYTDGKITTEVTNRNNAIASAKSDAIATAESYTDAQIAAGNGTATPTYEALNVNSVSLVASAKVSVPTAGTATAYSWSATEYATAKALVKFSTSTHTQVTEVLLTLDAANNIAITQFGEVGTNGELGTITANYAAGVVYITVTTNQSSTDVMTYATLIQ
jgi:trimeric autotransporter adhesin